MFSKSCEYGIRATLFIAQKSVDEQKVGIDLICDNIEAPRHFTAKVMQILTGADIVSSKKGVNGGFYMTQEQKNASIISIVNAIDGNEIFTRCAIGLKSCSENKPCPIHCGFKAFREELKTMLTNATIIEMVEKLEDGSSFLKL
ncbi:MAG: Rrf2 family transcriptional regulator [Chitinophagaceae bacterium]|nr:Rrf2 family transcriptional regulator [Chitinophagaceae bacterium]MCB0698360.1 Rrf2 family transcriptional regulator [Chitinophagaceae bacterium]